MVVLMMSLTIVGLEEGQDVNSPHNLMSVNIKVTVNRVGSTRSVKFECLLS